jgi:TonB-dependent receptor
MFGRSARTARVLRCGASTIVLGAALLQADPALAQTQPPPDSAGTPISQRTSTTNPTPPSAPEKSAIIITGQRRALRTSQQIKKNADTVVDSITATDIGSFPDKSVAEALQRIPGIQVSRIAAPSDVSHFSAEPSGVLIRGLPQVRSEFNGRDTFSANSSRGLDWSDITPELLAGVDAYKNQTADMIEGGIAGTIDLRTRVPFDASGQLIQIGGHINYNSLAKKWTPDGNVFYSNRWQTGIGEIGIMGDVAYSDLKTRNDMTQLFRTMIFEQGSFPGSTDNTFDSTNFAPGTVLAPSGLTNQISDYDRKRIGVSAAAQWRSNDHRWLATVQYLRSNYSNQNEEHGVTSNFFSTWQQTVRQRYSPSFPSTVAQAPGTPDFTFDQNGLVETGTFAQNVGWWGNPGEAGGTDINAAGGYGMNDQGEPFVNACYTWSCPSGGVPGVYGTTITDFSRYWKDREMTQDASLNLKWNPSDDLHFNFDAQYVDATVKNYDVGVGLSTWANIGYDATGTYPRMTFLPPTGINLSQGGLANPDNWWINYINDHLEDSKGHELALRGDGEYDFHSDWLDSVKFGVRYADRKQLVQTSTYNWHGVSDTWHGACNYIYFNLDSQPGSCSVGGTSLTFNGYPSGYYDVQPFGAPFFGGSLGNFPFVPMDFLKSNGVNGFNADVTGVGGFVPICYRNGQHTVYGDVLPTELPNSCFTQDEINNVDEKTTAAYVMLKFGGNDSLLAGRFPIRGNIGLRFVETHDSSAGAITYPTTNANPALCPATALVPGGLTGTAPYPLPLPPGAPPGTIVTYPSYCYMTPQDLAFANGGDQLQSAKNHFRNVLPSFNVRIDITPKWLVRFAASKAISRPDIGYLKNYLGISMGVPNGSDLFDPRWVLNAQGVPIGVNPTYTATAYNPYLKPVQAWQFDVSLEHYFGQAGQFSLAFFHKAFKDYIQSGSFTEAVTNNGVTRDVVVTGPANGRGAKIDGMEVAYSSFFDFLPGPLSGLGVQANYTYVRNKGVPNENLLVDTSNGSTLNNGTLGTALDPGTLQGVSKHTVNLIGMYEKGRISARIAYNWRSKFLVTPIDCCVYLPIWEEAVGYLDGSIRFRVTDSIELSLEGQNLLNTKARLMQQITDKHSPEGKIILVPESWNESDRRIIIGARWKLASGAAPSPPPVALPPPPPPAAATQTCADGSVILATDMCPAPAPPPPPAAAPERGW